jgi:uncharacterized membrane protein
VDGTDIKVCVVSGVRNDFRTPQRILKDSPMKMNNPAQMNDWDIKNFLAVIFSLQLSILSLICLDAIGLHVPIIRQIIGFIYLSFVPGIIILRIVKLHKLGNIETLLYAVGLSLTILMFIGFFLNLAYPFFGISKPMSLVPVVVTISTVVLAMCAICYVRDQDFAEPNYIDGDILSPPLLFLCLIPIMSVFGTYLVNFHLNNMLLMLMILTIAFVGLLISFDKFIPSYLYPFAVIMIALSLLYHNSLISMYLVEWADGAIEYWVSNTVVINSIWDLTIPNVCNAMLSLVMMAPIYSIFLNLEVMWVFKIVYPLLYSLVPLGLYRIFQKQIDDKLAFFSCFFFISMFSFYTTMHGLLRQQIAEFFFMLSILIFIGNDDRRWQRSFLFIIFGISIAVSHYALSYIYIISSIVVWLLLVSYEYKSSKHINMRPSKILDRAIPLFIAVSISWYIYLSSSSAFNSIIYIVDHIICSISTEFLNPQSVQGLDILITRSDILLGYFDRSIHYLTLLFITAGILSSLLKCNETNINFKYLALSVPFFGMCLAGVTVPHFAAAISTVRLYHITLILLAPYCIIGGLFIMKALCKIIKIPWTNETVMISKNILSVILVLYLLFNTGLVYESTKQSRSFALNTTISTHPHFNEQEVISMIWLDTNGCSNIPAYKDFYNAHLWMMFSGSFSPLQGIEGVTTIIRPEAYFFLGTENIKNDILRLDDPQWSRVKQNAVSLQNSTFYDTLRKSSKTYDNGGAEIYYHR